MWYWGGRLDQWNLFRRLFLSWRKFNNQFLPFLRGFPGRSPFLGAFLLREETFPMSTIHWGNCLSLGALELITFPITLLSRRPLGFFLGLAVRALAKFHFNK